MLWVGMAAVAGVAALVYGCAETSFGTCAGNGMCPVPGVDATAPPAEGGDDAGVSQGTTSDAGSDGSPGDSAAANASDGGDGGDGATCDPTADPSTAPCIVSDAYGVFVSAGASAGGNGLKASPYNTIAAGIGAAATGSKRVFVCIGTYPEELVVGAASDGIAVYGGFDCTNWGYASTNSVKVAPTQPGYALEVDSLTTGATFEDIEFDAQDAQDAGASSIAVFANQTVATFRRVVMRAGNGAAGAAGAAGVNYPVDAGRAENGNSADGSVGATGIECTCLNNSSSVGGAGGAGGSPPSDGSRGQPLLDGGQPGSGGATCTNGSPGAPGSDGDGGVGASLFGSTSPQGWAPAVGQSGTSSSAAQGGGGGGGTSGAAMAGGGASGGCGGCGGGGGAAGLGGGSSFALLSYQSTVTLDTCQLRAGTSGAGGFGGAGQAGQSGGFSGDQSNPGCPGGTGGAGGGGGGGGGGAGGISAAIAYTPPAPTGLDAGVTPQFGEAGAGGAGGAGGGASNAGGMGINGTAGPIIQL
jgi:hypothetical protein